MSYDRMKRFISVIRKSEWDKILAAMVATKTPDGGDKKKVQAGQNSLSQDGRQE